MTENKRPNIIFIMSDDHGPWAFGRGSNPDAKTPNLDRLADTGCVMDNYFAMSPVCSPARACLLTSRYSTETGITDFLGKDPQIGLSTDFMTWPRLLNQSGYTTGLFGKWHVGEIDEHHPTRHGYDEFKGWRGGAGISKDPVVEIDGRDQKVEGYTPDIITDYALDFVDRNKSEPFLVSLHYWAPHANQGVTTEDGDRTWHPLSPQDWDLFKDLDPVVPHADYPNLNIPRVKRMLREYLAAVHSIDRNVGRLLDKLDSEGLSDNTIIVYTSDNGYNLGHNGIWHKGNGWWILTNNHDGYRPNIYDNSLRLPAIVRWPGRTKAGSNLKHVVSSMDWFPTLCRAAGLDGFEQYGIRGRDFSGLFDGSQNRWDEQLFAQYRFWDWNQTGASLRMMRTPQWKLVRDMRKTVPDELYYLVEDPSERHNLIDVSESQVIKHREALNSLMREYMQKIDDPDLHLMD
ncbi:Arylsulfatase [Limihaloglobus sulfuriphilus]|uniref:Arylsulfatase n=1 Tax=Limihaloglobus sulfuriphilus TaxID=1851148 RepID=A0A1Q2MEL0_9BACT|nr:sulfatase-like hydrolase/transferase [Limihaloglobus sulfuriphilus]AQQ71143.1 Arylsulfatase [Limihaloglobus sulfuriphilus]